MTLNCTLGSRDQESFDTVANADIYFAKHLDGEIWTALETTAKKESCLFQGSRTLDASPIFSGYDNPYFSAEPAKQKYKLPSEYHESYSGVAESGTTLTLTDSNLANTDLYRSDQFNGGSLYISDGANIYEIRRISGFNVTTGTITVEEAFSSVIAADDSYVMLMPLEEKYSYALFEMALEISKGNWDATINGAVLAGGKIPDNLLPAQVLWILGAHNRSTIRVRRT